MFQKIRRLSCKVSRYLFNKTHGTQAVCAVCRRDGEWHRGEAVTEHPLHDYNTKYFFSFKCEHCGTITHLGVDEDEA